MRVLEGVVEFNFCRVINSERAIEYRSWPDFKILISCNFRNSGMKGSDMLLWDEGVGYAAITCVAIAETIAAIANKSPMEFGLDLCILT